MSEQVIHGFSPSRVFSFFEQISAIPRESGNEAGVADYLVRFASERGLSYVRDDHHNVLIKAPATAGRENDAPLLFQGHTDMVCEKNGDVAHDFARDPIRLRLDGTRLSAYGTTLGGDDGIAVAMMLALLDGEVVSHPAYECLFTTEEETGMGGAIAFDYSLLCARHMINLDSEQENQITVGCAGGIRSDLTIPVIRCTECEPWDVYRVRLSGLCGGHSGEDINKGRANANLLMGRLLAALPECRLIDLHGGAKDNAIPRECEAVVAVPCAQDTLRLLQKMTNEIKGELVGEDQGFRFTCEQLWEQPSGKACAMDALTTARVIGVLTNVPCGVLAMSHEMEGLVEFSRNLGVIRTQADTMTFTLTTRSSKESRLDASIQALNALSVLCEGHVHHHSRYPGWEYVPNTALRSAYLTAYQELYGNDIRVSVIHAGLECGYIKQQVPDMDIISIGPDMQGIHSPDEVLFLDSVERVWRVLERLINGWHVSVSFV